MFTIFVLFVGLTLATAVIAYWSDNLGKKLGKKRVSLWGLRPRTTATFLTIASSWLIMIFTLGVMLTLFPLLRRSLLHYNEVRSSLDQAQAQERDLRQSTQQLKGQLVELQGQGQSLRDQVASASGNLAKVQTQLTQSRAAATQARAAATKARLDATRARQSASAATARQSEAVAREAKARQNLSQVSAQLGATKQQREAARQQLSAAKSELSNANADVKSANARVKVAIERVKIATDKVRQAEAQLTRTQTDLSRVQTDLSTAQRNQKRAEESAKSAEERAKRAGASAVRAGRSALDAGRDVLIAERRVAQLTAQSEQLTRKNVQLDDDNKKIRKTANFLSQNDVRVPVDSTLVERTFDQFMTVAKVRDALQSMFDYSAQKIVPNLLPDAKLSLAVVNLPDAGRSSTENEIYDNLASFIANNPDPLSVRLVAARNHLAGEDTLKARFFVLPIVPALKDDFELTRTEVDGRASEGSLFGVLLKLVDKGTDIAKKKGVRPPLSPDSPNFYAPGSNEQIFDALREIKAIGGPTRVRIITTQPISTADQLSVRFEVEPVSAVTTQATARLSPRTPRFK